MKAKYDDLLAKNEAGQLSDNLRQLGQQEMGQLQQDLADHNQQSQDALVKRRSVLFKPILKQVNETIQEVSKSQNYSLVFDVQEAGVVYGDVDINLTKAVLLALGVDQATIDAASGGQQ
jgi:Skp family chaperone for outer membrane proteins